MQATKRMGNYGNCVMASEGSMSICFSTTIVSSWIMKHSAMLMLTEWGQHGLGTLVDSLRHGTGTITTGNTG